MAIGTSLFLIAVGAILRFAVYYSVHGIALNVVGIVLMVVGVLGMVLSFVMGATPWSARTDPMAPRGYRGERHSSVVDPVSGQGYEEHTYVQGGGPRI